MPINDGLEYGETPNGFIAPRYPDLRAWLVRRAIERFGKNVRTEPTSRIGWVIDRIAWAMSIVFLACLGAYNAAFYSSALGVDLDKQLALVAFFRLTKTKSIGELVVFGADLTPVPIASRVATEDTGAAFATDVEVVIGKKVRIVEITQRADLNDNWLVTINGDVYNYVQLAVDEIEDIARGLATAIGSQGLYFAGYLGARPGGGHMLVIDSLGPDLAVTLTPPAPGTGLTHFAARVAITAAEYGPVQGFAGTINEIKNPVFGWNGACNQRDVTLGRNTESDAEYRARWDRERTGPGKSTEKAMKAAFAATQELRDKVQAIRIEELPTQWFKVIILAPDLTNDEIAQIIWDNKPLGVATEGADQGVAKNVNNEDKVVKFQRATELFVWLKISITKALEGFPLIGDAAEAIAREVAVWGNGGPSPSNPFLAYAGLGLGGDLVRFQLGQPLNRACAGVQNAVITVATKPNPNIVPLPGDYDAADLPVAQDEILRFDSTHVIVTIL